MTLTTVAGRIGLVLAASALVAASVGAADWRTAGSSYEEYPDGQRIVVTLSIDYASIKREAPYWSASVREHYSKPLVTPDGKPYVQLTSRYVFDCAKRRYDITSASVTDAAGLEVDRFSASAGERHWVQAEPASSGEEHLKAVCAYVARTGKAPPATH